VAFVVFVFLVTDILVTCWFFSVLIFLYEAGVGTVRNCFSSEFYLLP
jgi:hypothetical protein